MVNSNALAISTPSTPCAFEKWTGHPLSAMSSEDLLDEAFRLQLPTFPEFGEQKDAARKTAWQELKRRGAVA